jgi:hypothetical protein
VGVFVGVGVGGEAVVWLPSAEAVRVRVREIGGKGETSHRRRRRDENADAATSDPNAALVHCSEVVAGAGDAGRMPLYSDKK